MEHLDKLPEIVQIAHMFPTTHKVGRTPKVGDSTKEIIQGHNRTMVTGMRRKSRIKPTRPRIHLPRSRRECRLRSKNQSHLNDRIPVQKQVLRPPSDQKKKEIGLTQ